MVFVFVAERSRKVLVESSIKMMISISTFQYLGLQLNLDKIASEMQKESAQN